jgi:hypothetical protein
MYAVSSCQRIVNIVQDGALQRVRFAKTTRYAIKKQALINLH